MKMKLTFEYLPQMHCWRIFSGERLLGTFTREDHGWCLNFSADWISATLDEVKQVVEKWEELE